MNAALREYIETEILPRYADSSADGHGREHVETVIRESLYLAGRYGADEDMCYAIAAYHDLGIPQGRKTHHLTSAAILAADARLREWFCNEHLAVMKEAVEDHRASAETPPRSLYGCIIADADHYVEPENVIMRTLLYGRVYFPGLTPEQEIVRAREHLQEKYCENGYLHFHLNDQRSTAGLDELRRLTANDEWFEQTCRRCIARMAE